jgi:3-ketosteroid 9alpha-monooxygenase subunit B
MGRTALAVRPVGATRNVQAGDPDAGKVGAARMSVNAQLMAPPLEVRPLADRGFHSLGVRQVVRETADATTFLFHTPEQLAGRFRYAAGQFLTVRVVVHGEEHLRCYSMSSAPALEEDLRVTVKRVPGGTVSNWLNDAVREGDELEVAAPGGNFVLGEAERDIVAFAGGSGITPVFSIVKTALATSARQVRLLYANRDRQSVIFGEALSELATRHEGRLVVAHHLDDEKGFVGPRDVAAFLDAVRATDFYVCGPTAFMDTVADTLTVCGIPSERVHTERFVVAPWEEARIATRPEPGAVEVTFQVGGRKAVAQHQPGATLLRTARSAGLKAPASCETGACATCMAKVVEGCTIMRTNGALTTEEVAEGWVLTCQAVPTSSSVTVVYE